ncbi:MAG: AhpC/TSA family protein [Bryobacterales bacterium]|nr:AhpC/TSA family protein [Bryobacterales bacterium]
MGWTIVTNDLIWWIPFALILRESYRAHVTEPPPTQNPAEIVELLSDAKTQTGISLAELAEESRLLVVFLRHMGCTFCRETLGDLARDREAIEMSGTQIVLVHMSPEETAGKFFARYGLADVERISDPQRKLYRAFGLRRGAFSQLFGWRIWLRGFDAGILHGHGVGKLQGDGFQMPGVFLLTDGQLVRSFRHLSASDRPRYAKLTQCGPESRGDRLKP